MASADEDFCERKLRSHILWTYGLHNLKIDLLSRHKDVTYQSFKVLLSSVNIASFLCRFDEKKRSVFPSDLLQGQRRIRRNFVTVWMFYLHLSLQFLYDVIMITESWFNQSVFDEELFDANWIVYRRDRDSNLDDPRERGVYSLQWKLICVVLWLPLLILHWNNLPLKSS